MKRPMIAVGAAVVFSASLAHAQAVDVQHYEPAVNLEGLGTVKGAGVERAFTSTLLLTTLYLKEPLLVLDEQGNPVRPLIDNRVDVLLSYGMSLHPRLALAAVVPYVPYQNQPVSITDGQLVADAQSANGMADPRIVGRITVLTQQGQGINVALIPVVTLPGAAPQASSSRAGYISGRTTVVTGELAIDRRFGPVLVAVNAGYRYRPNGAHALRRFDNLELADQLLWRGGLGLDLHAIGMKRDSQLGVEAFGLTSTKQPFKNITESPAEVMGSLRIRIKGFTVSAGGGAGIGEGYGTPKAIAMLGLAWAPRITDRDGDGIDDDVDRCPDVAEDLDQFEDDDGCPDADNDRDALLDDNDACPDDPEDFDKYQDDDGCPEPDNDGDKILDGNDKCPLLAEDIDNFEDDDGCPEEDNDKDKIKDLVDACPNEPEDYDKFQDTDGCPDPDNDGDGILDAKDKCPNQAEDVNGYKDDDGCPDAKDDKDGDDIADKVDKCPKDPEDKDGFQDEDGCPDPDNDKDGVPDYKDSCPNEPEDKDGFLDNDGCPEDDNDGDGLLDAVDKCPNQAETINAFEDEDGCPDKGPELVKLTFEKIEIKEKVHFDTDSDVIQSRSFGLLDQVVAVLKNHAELGKTQVEGHTDDRGSDSYNEDLSQRRAESVRKYLVDHGVDGGRLAAMGYGEAKPIASNKSERGRETNRRVEFTIVEHVERPKPSLQSPPTPPAPAKPPETKAEPPKPAAPSGQSEARDPGFFYLKIKKGQTLREISTALWKSDVHAQLLQENNPEVAGLDAKVASGGTVKFPRQIQYTVQKGEMLGDIAKKQLGNVKHYKLIADASRSAMPDANKMEPGMVLTIPLVLPDIAKLEKQK